MADPFKTFQAQARRQGLRLSKVKAGTLVTESPGRVTPMPVNFALCDAALSDELGALYFETLEEVRAELA